MKYSLDAVKNIVKSLNAGSTIKAACNAAGISTVTYFSWHNKDPKFAAMVDKAKNSRIGFVEDALYKSCVNGSVSAQKYFLNNRQSHKWKDEPIVINYEQKVAVFQQIHNKYNGNGNGNGELHDSDTRSLADNSRDRLQVVE